MINIEYKNLGLILFVFFLIGLMYGAYKMHKDMH